MLSLGAATAGFDVQLYCTAKWCKWHPDIVNWARVVCIGRDLGYNIGVPKDVQSED